MSRFREFVSNVAALTYKEATIVRHDRAFLTTVLVQPWIMFLVFGAIVSNKPSNVPWGVFDQSQSALSRRLVQEIQASGYFLPPVRASSYDFARERLPRRRAARRAGDSAEPRARCRARHARASSYCSTVAIRSRRLASAPYVSRIAAAVEPRLSAPTAFDADATVRKPDRSTFAPLLVSTRISTTAVLSRGTRRHAAHQPLLVGRMSGAGRRAPRAGTYEQILALRRGRSRSCSVSSFPSS